MDREVLRAAGQSVGQSASGCGRPGLHSRSHCAALSGSPILCMRKKSGTQHNDATPTPTQHAHDASVPPPLLRVSGRGTGWRLFYLPRLVLSLIRQVTSQINYHPARLSSRCQLARASEPAQMMQMQTEQRYCRPSVPHKHRGRGESSSSRTKNPAKRRRSCVLDKTRITEIAKYLPMVGGGLQGSSATPHPSPSALGSQARTLLPVSARPRGPVAVV